MLGNLKVLVVILAIGWAVCLVCEPICLSWMSSESYRRRRNIWFALTIVAFASSNFWIFATFAFVLLGWAAYHDENPPALYLLLLFVVPNDAISIPAPLVNQLFNLTPHRILSLAILIPAIAGRHRIFDSRGAKVRLASLLLVAFLLQQIVSLMPYENFTNTMRRTFLALIDTYVVFHAFCRMQDRERISEAIACFWLACAIMAGIGIFESVKGWLLYTGLSASWGAPNEFSWLFRGASLRAQGASGHSINLGYHVALGIGMFSYLRTRVKIARARELAIWGLLAAGTLVSYSRGAWATALLVVMFFAALRPDAKRTLGALLGTCGLLVVLAFFTPLKESVIERLPFIGSADQDTIQYRSQLAEVSWQLILQNPYFGDPFVYLRMESLRQGQGIIDIVSGYLMTALFNGFVGLFLLVSGFAIALIRGLQAMVRFRSSDMEGARLGAMLLACLGATLVFISTANYETTIFVFSGCLLAYWSTSVNVEPAMAAHPNRLNSRPAVRNA
jgi:hypothetical protein